MKLEISRLTRNDMIIEFSPASQGRSRLETAPTGQALMRADSAGDIHLSFQ
jgi:hypothetical protein